MIRLAAILVLLAMLAGCASKQGTIGQLRQVDIDIEKENVPVGLDKAIESYERFLARTEETPMTAEAIRRLADLKIEREYGLVAAPPGPAAVRVEDGAPAEQAAEREPATPLPSGKEDVAANAEIIAGTTSMRTGVAETDVPAPASELERAGAQEAVELYRQLLDDFPAYERNDETLYQLSRAYEEQGQVEDAMQVMDRLVAEYPDSRYLAEVQFRRAEYFFARRRYVDAEEAYASVVAAGERSDFYVRALYKRGWSFYKQDLYEEGLHSFIALLDYAAANAHDFEGTAVGKEEKRFSDTLRIASQSFSNLGGVDAVIDYFKRHGGRTYEDVVYANLAEFYFSKKRYNDAATAYTAFIARYPAHFKAPLFALRVIDISKASGFPTLVLEAKKKYVGDYRFGADYWKHFNPDNRPEVVASLKTNLIDLANHYHARYQDKRFAGEKAASLEEALRWYREFLGSFPRVAESPAINYQLAELLLESRDFVQAAQEFEKTAYAYPVFSKADRAGYAAVYAFRQQMAEAVGEEREQVRRDAIRSSLKFSEFYPEHEKAATVLGEAVEDLYSLREFNEALKEARDLIARFPSAAADVRRSAWLVAAHSSFELKNYSAAEAAYLEVLQLLPEDDGSRAGLVDNLAASIYKQGEAANRSQRYKNAAEHFLRVTKRAPSSRIRPVAEFDAAVALVKVEEWQGAAAILTGFRRNFPRHELQHEVTRKLAYVYRELGELSLAAAEFERIGFESTEPAVQQEALLVAAELYEQVDDSARSAEVYRRYVEKHPVPADVNVEARDKLAAVYEKQGNREMYLDTLRRLVTFEADAGPGQTVRTRLIAGSAALVLARADFDACLSVRLVKPFKANLQRKQSLMKKVTETYTKLFDYEIGDVTAEAMFHLAEIYADFSVALLESERPEGLSALETEQYELALEEQAYPFEEKAIEMHQSNLELMARGIYNDWIDMSLNRLSGFMPARYAKQEEENRQIAPFAEFRFPFTSQPEGAGETGGGGRSR